jgi:two-component system sensor histidine kinase EvgS
MSPLITPASSCLTCDLPHALCSGLIIFLLLGLLILLAKQQRMRHAQKRQQQDNWTLQAMIAHEVQTPLNAMAQLLDMATSTDLQVPDRAELLKTLRSTMYSMQELMEDMLTRSKLASGKLQLNLQPAHLPTLMTDMARTYDTLARKKGLQFRYNSQFASSYLRIDASKIKQILNNLLSNAIKFTTRGKIELTVESRKKDPNRIWVGINVEDSGIGIPADAQQQIFTAFSPAGDKARQHFGGNGLGLSLSRQLAELMQGRLTIVSTPGQGTRISFEFECEPISPRQECFTGLSALIVDDNSANQMLLKLQLEQLGLNVRCSDNGQQALTAWQEQGCDIMFCDLHMPELSGEQLIETIRSLERRQQKVATPIIAISAEPDHDKTPAGAQYRLGKPTNTDDLIHALNLCRPVPAQIRHYPHIRLDIMQQLSNGDGDFENQFIQSVLKNNQQDIESLQQALGKKDRALAAETLHRLLGIVRLLGEEHLTEQCRQLEKALRSGQPQHIKVLLPEIEGGIRLINQELRQYQQTLAAARLNQRQ